MNSSDNQNLLAVLKDFPGSKSVKPFENRIQLAFSNGLANLEQLNKFCFDQGIVLNHLQLKKKSLESKFFELTNTSEADN